jgi:hypothetical protein
VAFLREAQLPHGEFRTLLGSDDTLADGVLDSSPFATTHVVYALGDLGEHARPLIDRALAFLRSEMEPGGLWRYYASRQWKHTRIPPDLDDTCCASFVLARQGWRVPRNRWLILANRDPQGRFGTWMIPTPRTGWLYRMVRARGDARARRLAPPRPAGLTAAGRFARPTDEVHPGEIDAVVNANVLLYVGESPETAAAVEYVASVVAGGLGADATIYYTNPLSLAYAVARAQRHGVSSFGRQSAGLARAIEAHWRVGGQSASPLTAALAGSALLTLAPESHVAAAAVGRLLETQRSDGSWPREVFYRGPEEFWGSDELTTGLCLEVLGRWGSGAR